MDTLFLYLHDIDFNDHDSTINPNFQACKNDNRWGYSKLSPGSKSCIIKLKFKKKVNFQYLCIYYSSYKVDKAHM